MTTEEKLALAERLLRDVEWCVNVYDSSGGPWACFWCGREEPFRSDARPGAHHADCPLALLLGLPTDSEPCSMCAANSAEAHAPNCPLISRKKCPR